MESPNNLADYDALSEVFEWESMYAEADWDAPDTINIAHEVCDRHITQRGTVGLYFVGRNDERQRITYWELAQWSNRFANILDTHDIERGDRVFAYLPRIPERFVAMLGTLKAGSVFGAIDRQERVADLRSRLLDGSPTAVVTTPERRDVVSEAIADVPSVDTVMVISDDGTGIYTGDISYYAAMERASPSYDTVETAGSDPALLYYTRGTSGTPKGVVHGHRWIVGIATAQLYAADLHQHETDLYWGTGRLGWLTAPVNKLGVWFWGHSLVIDNGPVDADRWIGLLDELPVTVLFAIPAVYRRLREHDSLLEGADLDLRRALSTGSPIDPDLVEWGRETLGIPIHESYGQAETGNMLINTYPSIETRPGTIGKPLPGVDVGIVDPETGTTRSPGEIGQIAVLGEFPSFFRGYWEDPERTEAAFVDDWYLTGDHGSIDDDGYVRFEGRAAESTAR